ncbi:MAG TPA: alcohol dehydrogenase catalytic domain-containing protein [Planctomycetota bacterium]|nr:alcohol dehydrogenase catalytic domain-containing protein [Planctomycetota bacterium]HRR79282.1 alcohol dehydrogenase catalytic domain-containing protein [Planctomycetota bacterium]HRT97018.1 alcohol dehydrogenase catalytic domain-containing protein [Planctomycetota bacterium]
MAKKAAGKTMKAQVFYEPLKMAYEDAPMPVIAADEVLVRVKACGICGSDIAYYYGMSSLETPTGKGPLVLGHEYTGEVVEVGDIPKSLKLFKPGDRVVLDPVQYCNACDVCYRGQTNLCENKAVLGVSCNGGFAEYSKSKYTGVHPLPDNVSFEHGALTEPLGCATYAVKNLEVQPGQFVVVIGPGAIGCMMVQLVKKSGAGAVALLGTRDYRLEIGRKLGADLIINDGEKNSPYYVADIKAKIADLTKGKMADRVVVATGSVEAMELALAISGRRSVIVYFGLPGDKAVIRVPALQSILWDKTIRFSWLAPNVWQTALGALATGLVDVSPLVSHTYKLADLVGALGKVKDRVGNPMKPVVVP